MKIAILGTRGIPNNYGGFEQFAEYLSVGLLNKGNQVVVYNSHNHSYKSDSFKGGILCEQEIRLRHFHQTIDKFIKNNKE